MFTMLFTIKLSDCQTVKANIGNTVILRSAVDAVDSVFCIKLGLPHALGEHSVHLC